MLCQVILIVHVPLPARKMPGSGFGLEVGVADARSFEPKEFRIVACDSSYDTARRRSGSETRSAKEMRNGEWLLPKEVSNCKGR